MARTPRPVRVAPSNRCAAATGSTDSGSATTQRTYRHFVAGCLGMLGWLSVEQIRDGRPTTFGAASGVVAGLVAITLSCGTVNTLGSAVVGVAAGVVCSFAIGAKFHFNYDDSLDVVGVHFVGGVVGVSLIGLLATAVMTSGPQGLFYGGGFAQLGKQALAIVVVALYAFAVSFVLAK